MPVPKVSDVQSDVELIRLAALRDETAIRQIIRTYNRRLYRLARAIIGNDADAEDVVQEAYIRAFNKLNSFRREASLSTWLSRITINEALMRQRSKHTLCASRVITYLPDKNGSSPPLMSPIISSWSQRPIQRLSPYTMASAFSWWMRKPKAYP